MPRNTARRRKAQSRSRAGGPSSKAAGSSAKSVVLPAGSRSVVAAAPMDEPAEIAERGRRAMAAGQNTSAAEEFLALRAKRPKDPRGARGLAAALAALGNRKLAAEILRGHLNRDPADVAAWRLLADVLTGLSDKRGALDALARATALDPGQAEAFLQMARLWWNLGSGDAARRYVRNAIHLAPANADAHYLLGIVYEKWGRTGDAYAELRLARELECDAEDLAGKITTLSDGLAADKQQLNRLHQETAGGGDLRKLYDLAKYQVRTGDLTAALSTCDRVIAASPQSGEYHELRARILTEDDRPEEGLAAAVEAAELSGDKSVRFVYERRVSHRYGAPAERLGFYEGMLRDRPNRPETYLNLALLQAAGDGPGFGLQAALQSFAMGLRGNPDHAGLHLHRGEVLFRFGRPAEAAEAFRCAVDEEPHNARTLDRWGAALLAKGDLDPARTAFRKALDIQAQFDRAHFHLGRTAEAAGDLDAACASYRQALRINRRMLEARLCLADALRRQGRWEEAEENCRQVLYEEPASGAALFTLADLLDLRGRTDEAEQAYRDAISALRSDTGPVLSARHAADLLRAFGAFLAKTGRGDDALEHLDAAAKLAANDAVIAEQTASVLLDLGRAPAAIRLARSALRLEPDRISASFLLTRAYIAAGKWSAAAGLAEKLTVSAPQAAPAWTMLGQCRAHAGRWADAAACFRSSLERDTRNAGAILGLLDAARRPAAGVSEEERRRWLVRGLALARSEVEVRQMMGELARKTD